MTTMYRNIALSSAFKLADEIEKRRHGRFPCSTTIDPPTRNAMSRSALLAGVRR